MLLQQRSLARLFITISCTCILSVYVLLYCRGSDQVWTPPSAWRASSSRLISFTIPSPENNNKNPSNPDGESGNRHLAQHQVSPHYHQYPPQQQQHLLQHPLPLDNHTVSTLIHEAHKTYATLLQNTSHTLAEAAARYRERRGRHPPPGFGAWFKAAQKRNAVVVEAFFDRIYRDLAPFWAVEASELRRKAHTSASTAVLRVRGHNTSLLMAPDGGDNTNRLPRAPLVDAQRWEELVREVEAHLPDLDMPLNMGVGGGEDKSSSGGGRRGVLLAWEQVHGYLQAEAESRTLFPIEEAQDEYTGYDEVLYDALHLSLGEHESKRSTTTPTTEDTWIPDVAGHYWDYVRAACPPESPARSFKSLNGMTGQPIDSMYPINGGAPLPYTRGGFVANYSASQDVCFQPHLRGMHSAFVESVRASTTVMQQQLVPLFSGSKLSPHNDILLPSASHLAPDDDGGSDDEGGYSSYMPFSAAAQQPSRVPWSAKSDAFFWRGTAGATGEDQVGADVPWWRLHRHRWVQILNGSTVRRVEAGDQRVAPTFRMPPQGSVWRELPAVKAMPAGRKTIGDWLGQGSVANVSFTGDVCLPLPLPPDSAGQSKRSGDGGRVGLGVLGEREKKLLPIEQHQQVEEAGCAYGNDFYSTSPGKIYYSMLEQEHYKYLPDIDDSQSASGRWRRILSSSSCPLKASVYTEWHDDRLVPWVHFVPLDNSYQDVWAVMDYFLYGHDGEGERIAAASREWAAQVLRREDMVLYVWRLLLEYARAMDPQRERLGFVEDLLKKEKGMKRPWAS